MALDKRPSVSLSDPPTEAPRPSLLGPAKVDTNHGCEPVAAAPLNDSGESASDDPTPPPNDERSKRRLMECVMLPLQKKRRLLLIQRVALPNIVPMEEVRDVA